MIKQKKEYHFKKQKLILAEQMKVIKNLYKITFLLLVFFHQVGYSQFEIKETFLDENVKKLIYSNPEQALNITKLMLSKSNITENERVKINFLAAKAYRLKGDYSNALTYLFEEKNYLNYFSEEEKIIIELEKIAILRELSLDKEAQKKIDILEKEPLILGDSKLKTFKEASIILEKAKILLKEQNYTKGIENLAQELPRLKEDFPELEIGYKNTLGQFYFEKRDLKQATYYFEEALKKISLLKEENNYYKIYALSGLGKVYFQQKEYNKAIKVLTEANKDATLLKNLYLQEAIIKQLNVNYLALKDSMNYKLTNVNFTQISIEIEALEQESVNTAYNLITEEQIANYEQKESNYYRMLYISLGILLAISGIFGMVWWVFYQRKSRLDEIINYLKITRDNFINKIIEKKEEVKKVFIPKETELQLMNKLQKFESTKKFTNKDISLAVLAGQFDTNTKYLSEVINSNYHVNFNTYINKLRINYIVEKLKSDSNYINYKISYLAEDCGFSSHSSFATVFKSITGISPVTFIDLLKNEKENLENEH